VTLVNKQWLHGEKLIEVVVVENLKKGSALISPNFCPPFDPDFR